MTITRGEMKIACPSCEGQAPSRSAMRAQMTATDDTSGACGMCDNDGEVFVRPVEESVPAPPSITAALRRAAEDLAAARDREDVLTRQLAARTSERDADARRVVELERRLAASPSSAPLDRVATLYCALYPAASGVDLRVVVDVEAGVVSYSASVQGRDGDNRDVGADVYDVPRGATPSEAVAHLLDALEAQVDASLATLAQARGRR